jgi:hypothetical protein
MDCDDLDVGDTRAWRCLISFVYQLRGFFCPLSGFGLEHTLWISLLVVFLLFPLWHSICWSVFRFSF